MQRGYRLPTEAETEYAGRGKSTTSRFYGESDELLGKYAWYYKKSQQKSWPVAMLKPNVFTWCLDEYMSYKIVADKISEDKESKFLLETLERRVIRGGPFSHGARVTRSANRHDIPPYSRRGSLGFRLVKTL